MAEYVQINILDMLESLGEDECSKILSSFVCPLNSDVENFARNKAIQFAKQRIAITYLVFVHQENDAYLAGYYTIANKFRECKIVCVKSNCADLFYAPYWGKQLKGWISNGKT